MGTPPREVALYLHHGITHDAQDAKLYANRGRIHDGVSLLYTRRDALQEVHASHLRTWNTSAAPLDHHRIRINRGARHDDEHNALVLGASPGGLNVRLRP